MTCIYCKEEINEDATVCRHCGAYAVETDDEILWYRQGDSPSKVAWSKWWPWVAAAVVAIGGIFAVMKSDADAQKKADDLVDCVVAGETDC